MAATLTRELFDAFCRQEELGMMNGQRFAVAGYDLVAHAQVCEGGGPDDIAEFIVLGNNSTHYLVASRAINAPSAVLVASYEYTESEGSLETAYRLALRNMLNCAMRY